MNTETTHNFIIKLFDFFFTSIYFKDVEIINYSCGEKKVVHGARLTHRQGITSVN